MDVEKQTQKNTDKTINIDNKEKVIYSFEGLEKDFEKFMQTVEKSEDFEYRYIKQVLHALPKKQDFIEAISNKVKINNMSKKLEYEMSKLDSKIKEAGIKIIKNWNKTANNKQQVSSVRFVLNENNNEEILITLKDSYKIDDKALENKEIFGSLYGFLFEEKKVYSLKEEMVELLISSIEKAFGKNAASSFINIETKLKLKTDNYKKLMESNEVDDKVKKIISQYVSQAEPAIKCSK